MIRSFRTAALVSVIGLTVSLGAFAAAGEALELQTERAVVFKDGYSLIVKRATGRTDSDGKVFTDQVPAAAILGSFWSTASGKYPILSTTADWVETEELRTRETDCVNFVELLRANKGQLAILRINDERQISGPILGVLELKPTDSSSPFPPQPIRVTNVGASSRTESTQSWMPHGGTLVVIGAKEGRNHVLPVGQIRSMQVAGLVTTMTRVEKVKLRNKRLTYDFGAAAANRNVTIQLIYFTPGLRWIPTYRLTGALECDAELSLQAEILNELEDFDGVALDLVVGVPHFRFKNVVSPLALEGLLRNALAHAVPGRFQQQIMSNSFTQRSGESLVMARGAGGADVMATAPELAGAGNADLFVYGIPSFSLAKGARAAVSVWSDRIKLDHLYTLDIDMVRDDDKGAPTVRSRSGPNPTVESPLELASYQVWHQLQLRNEGEVPWTTGPAMVLRNGLPLGQDMLTYTPIGGETMLPVTVAVDVRGDMAEEEIGREETEIVVNGHKMVRIKKRGTITLTNFKDEAIHARVRLGLGGAVAEADHGGVITLNDYRAADWNQQRYMPNQHSDIDWKIELNPGEARNLTYVVVYDAY